MNKHLGLELIGYGVLLAGLSYLTYHLAPAFAQPVLVTGLAGGVLSLVWGILAVRGHRRKAGPLLTLVAIAYVQLSQAVLTWGGRGPGGSGSPLAPVVMVLMLALSMGMLIRIAYAGAVFDGQRVSPTKDGGAKSQTNGKPATQTNAVKRA